MWAAEENWSVISRFCERLLKIKKMDLDNIEINIGAWTKARRKISYYKSDA